jgi:hypothetical protein
VAFTCYLLSTPAFVVYSVLSGFRRALVLLVVAIAVVAIAVVIERRGRARAIRAIALVAVVVLVASTVTAVAEVVSPPPAVAAGKGIDDDTAGANVDDQGLDRSAPTIPDRPSGEQLPNVYHLILDEFQTDQFDLALDDRTRESLRGFTAFPEAMTSYGRTRMALADLYDPDGYDYSEPATEFVQQALLGPDSTLQQLRAAGYHAEGNIPSRSVWGTSIDSFDVETESHDLAATNPGTDDTGLATSMWIDATAPDAVTQRVIPARHYEQLAANALLPDDEAPIAVDAFRAFLHHERQEPATGRYVVVHLILPHRPYVLDPDCGYEAGRETDAVSQASCALHLVDDFVAELDRLGRFESSTIVVQGDHGAGLARQGDRLVSAGTEVFGDAWSTGRSRALLLVKPAGTGRGEALATSDRRAMTTDVMPTIFDSVGLPVHVGEDRVSLLADEFPERPERAYHFYDKGAFGLPDTQVVRFLERDGVLTEDGPVPVPARD